MEGNGKGMKEDILSFVRGVFEDAEDIGILTIGKIRKDYLAKTSKEKLNLSEKAFLKSTVEELYLEFASKKHLEEEHPKTSKKNSEGSEDEETSVKSHISSGKIVQKLNSSPDCKYSKEINNGDKDSEFVSPPSSPLPKVGGTKRKRALSDSESEGQIADSAKKTKRLAHSKARKLHKSEIKHLLESEGSEEEEPLSTVRSKSKHLLESEGSEEEQEEPLSAVRSKSESLEDKEDSEDETLFNLKPKSPTEDRHTPDKGSAEKAVSKKKTKTKKESAPKKFAKNENKPPKKAVKNDDSEQLKHLKSCCRAAGLFVHYNKVFSGCNTNDDKEKSLLQLLKESGLRGKPTVEGCKKLRLRREEKKALEDLDTANIISTTGRGQRHSAGSMSKRNSQDTAFELSGIKKTYSRLKGIVDSEASDSSD